MIIKISDELIYHYITEEYEPLICSYNNVSLPVLENYGIENIQLQNMFV